MRIWLDLTNSPHVTFFAGFISRLKHRGHEVRITSRPHANTEALLDLHGLPYQSVGRHYGRRRRDKARGFVLRCAQLYRALRRERLDVAISHSSFYQPVVARALGVRCLYLNDNEHAAGNHIAFRLADQVLVPSCLDRAKVEAQGARPDRIVAYPGVKEGLYLFDREVERPPPAERPTLYVRPEPWMAQYYHGGERFLDPVLTELATDHRVVVLPRGQAQREHYRTLPGVEVADRPLSLDHIVATCHGFLGAGGTMTRELAVLGVPTISTYRGDPLDVDRALIQAGCMVHAPDPTAEGVRALLAASQGRAPHRALLEQGREGAALIERLLLGEAA